MLTNETMASPLPSLAKNLKFDTVDGQKYSPQKHKKIAAVVKYRNAVNGNHVLAFSSMKKYNDYQKSNFSTQISKKKSSAARTYFYEHASFDSRGLGSWTSLGVRGSFYYVGDNWNDKISSVDIYPSSWVTFYQHWHYEGYYLTLVNNGNTYYWFQNLTNYKMPNGTNWNDQVSSIRTGWK
jgi:hypothetical protein